MKTFISIEAKSRFGQLIEAAQRQPVTVTRKDHASVVTMSVEGYEKRKKRRGKICFR